MAIVATSAKIAKKLYEGQLNPLWYPFGYSHNQVDTNGLVQNDNGKHEVNLKMNTKCDTKLRQDVIYADCSAHR